MDIEETLRGMIDGFYPYAQKRLGFNKPAEIEFVKDEGNANNPFGKTAHYEPGSMRISLYIVGRHVKDIMRSLSHELVHHTQNCRGDLSSEQPAREGYTQNDPFLREMEREAYEQGNLIFRDYEDSLKEKETSLMEYWDKQKQKLFDELMRRWDYKL